MFSKKNKKIDEKTQIEKFDIAIIGGGQTGLLLAKQLIKKEYKVLIIDQKSLGIKTSLDLKNFNKLIKRMIQKNQDFSQTISKFPQRLEFINKEQNDAIVSQIENNSYFKFEKGIPSEINEYDLTINDNKYVFKKLVIATGSYFDQPDEKRYPNLKRDMYFNLNEINKIDKLYKSVAIYGTNIQALELAYSFALLGTTVYLFDENVNPFNNFDDEIESILKSDFMPSKIIWCLESKITNHQRSSDYTTRILYTSQDKNKYIEVEKIFITDNQKSNISNLKTKYPLELNSKGSIIIDNTFRVKNNLSYYAIGDVNGISFLTSQTNAQAILLSKILTANKSTKFNMNNVAFTIDIEPQICFFGLNKADLDFQNIKFNEFIFDFNNELNSKLLSHKSKIKLFTNERHEILGVFLLGNKIKELLSILILAANNKIKFYKLSDLNFPFYSKSEFIRDAALEYELEFVDSRTKGKKGKIKRETKGD